eukprot:6524245-Prymnesium_polylepis.1
MPVCRVLLGQRVEADGDGASAHGSTDGDGEDLIDDEEDPSRVRAGDVLHTGLGIGCHVLIAGAGLLRWLAAETVAVRAVVVMAAEKTAGEMVSGARVAARAAAARMVVRAEVEMVVARVAAVAAR